MRDVQHLVGETLKRVGYDLEQSGARSSGGATPPSPNDTPAQGQTPLLGSAADPASTLLNAMAAALGASAETMSVLINDIAKAIGAAPPTDPPGSPGSVNSSGTVRQPAPHVGLITASANGGGIAYATISVTNDISTVVPNVVLTCTDLVSDSGHRIPASAVTIHPRDVTIGPGESEAFMIEVAIADTQEPELYAGVLGAQGMNDVQAVLKVHVNP